MLSVFFILLRTAGAALLSRRELVLENLALQHQLLVLNRKAGKPKLGNPGSRNRTAVGPTAYDADVKAIFQKISDELPHEAQAFDGTAERWVRVSSPSGTATRYVQKIVCPKPQASGARPAGC